MMGWPSVPTMSRPLRDGLVATYPLRTRPFAGHLQLCGSAALCSAVVLALAVCGAGVTALPGGGASAVAAFVVAGLVVAGFVVAPDGVLLACVLVVDALGDLIPEVCTLEDPPLLR